MVQGPHACLDNNSRDLADFRLDAGRFAPPQLLTAWVRALLIAPLRFSREDQHSRF